MKLPWRKDEPAVTWQRTDIERNLTNEWNQAQVDGGMAYSYYEKLLERDPSRAAKLLEQFEREATGA